MLWDKTFSANTVVKDGYEFRYTYVDFNKFELTATPTASGEQPQRSFFVDESGALHFTTEKRRAEANDEIR